MAHGFINEKTTHYPSLKSQLLIQRGSHAFTKFDTTNSHLRRSMVTPGQLVIVPDDSTASCTFEEAWLMTRAREVDLALSLEPRAGVEILNNYDLLQGLLGYSSIGIGSTTAAWGRHLSGVEDTLKEIEKLHQQHLKGGASARAEFIAKRQVLFQKLDTQLQGVGHYGTSLRHNKSIKKMLGISTRSYLHRQEVDGYAQRINKIASTSRFLSKGGYVGMALDVGAAGLAIQEACSMGREEQCRKARYVEGAKAAGGITGSYYGGKFGARAGLLVCGLGLGIVSGGWGALSCRIIGGAAGGYIGGLLGGGAGEFTGDVIYEGAH
ncbi:hypothetical protein [Pseudomonas sp. MWU12-2345]|uniref:hypothetical protein n=1 Tax=Pseudomonas sp. MWU12-2345 TaxID=2928689 RepID=UPI00200BD077|nr:hypothetical protein [Pseudomonas sp. MWU12-2345]